MTSDKRFVFCCLKGPNIIFVLIDDVGWADFGYNNEIATRFGAKENGNGQIPTPNINRLANKGLKLTSHYVHPTCTPSRYINHKIIILWISIQYDPITKRKI